MLLSFKTLVAYGFLLTLPALFPDRSRISWLSLNPSLGPVWDFDSLTLGALHGHRTCARWQKTTQSGTS